MLPKTCEIRTDFRREIQARNIELDKLRVEYGRKMERGRGRPRKEKTEEEMQMEKLIQMAGPEAIKRLLEEN